MLASRGRRETETGTERIDDDRVARVHRERAQRVILFGLVAAVGLTGLALVP